MKITITRLLEASKYLATEVGQQIPDFFGYMSELTDNVVRALRNGITFADNVDCTIRTVDVSHNVPQVIVLEGQKRAVGIIPIRILSTVNSIASFGWYYDDRDRLVIRTGFTSGGISVPASAAATLVTVSYGAHGLSNGDVIFVTSAQGTGTLPAGAYSVTATSPNQFTFTVAVAPTTLRAISFTSTPPVAQKVTLVILH